ncbi:MAG: helix-turn-helix domain-containing protein, partial [Vagococcus salmoninarum]
LMVTDDLALKNNLLTLLNKYFVNVFLLPHATSTSKALAIAKKHQPEIVMIDLNLPSEDAFLLPNQLLALHPNLRSIMVDDEANCQHAQTAIRLGAIDYLVQPLIEEEALNSIHRAIISLNQVSLLNHRKEDATATQNETILPMIQYIHSHAFEDINLDSLADFMHLNKNYLCQLFKKEVGMTYIAYLNQFRIEQAKLFLRTTTDKLAVIAEKVGYKDPAYFRRIFKKTTGISPHHYRQTYVGDLRTFELQPV